MIKKIAALLVVFFTFSLAGESPVKLNKIANTKNYSLHDFTISYTNTVSKTETAIKKIYLVNGTETSPKRVLLFFHGYMPAGDPYQQNPKTFITRMKLYEMAVRTKTVILIPETGAMIYNTSNVYAEDYHLLKNLCSYINERYPTLPVITAGVSTGVEGAVKSLPFLKNRKAFIGISGTYDYFTLGHDTGEFRMHAKFFGGIESNTWEIENPLSLIRKETKVKAYIFCEEKSIYNAQAKTLIAALPASRQTSYLELGKGHSHNWDFWGKSEVVNEFEKILDAY